MASRGINKVILVGNWVKSQSTVFYPLVEASPISVSQRRSPGKTKTPDKCRSVPSGIELSSLIDWQRSLPSTAKGSKST